MKIFNKKKYLIVTAFVLVIIITMIFLSFNKKNDGLKRAKDAIENIFFFLPETKYDNLNDIPDYCKVSLVYGTEFLSDAKYLDKDDHVVTKKNNKNTIKAYSKESLLKSLKLILGDEASIDLNANEDGEYQALIENGCGYNNFSFSSLTYDEFNEYIYSYEDDDAIKSKIYFKWEKPVINDDTVELTAKALLPIKNQDGSYTVYVNGERFTAVGHIDKGKKLEDELNKIYDEVDVKYNFILKKQGNNYIWINYEIVDNINNDSNLINDNYLITED